jgi:hypothetical protein
MVEEQTLVHTSLERLLAEAGSQLGCDIELVEEPVEAEAASCLYVPVRADDGGLVGTLICAGGELGEQDVRALHVLANAIAELGDDRSGGLGFFRAAFVAAIAGLGASLALAIGLSPLLS